MDRAEPVEEIELVNEEARYRRDNHQRHPDPAEQPVQRRALGAQQDIGTEKCRRRNSSDMDLNGERGAEERFEGHGQHPVEFDRCFRQDFISLNPNRANGRKTS